MNKIPVSLRFFAIILIILGVSLLIFLAFMSPPLNELALIAGSLSVTAIISALAGYAAYRLGWMNRSPSLRLAMIGSYALACLLTFFNVWVTARLMFASEHDLLLGTVLLFFAGAIAIALGYLLATSFVERIGTLDKAAQDIAQGQLSARAPVAGEDELAKLAITFNNMAEQLEKAEEQQKQIEELRRELIAWVGHDLQTPLASISAIIEALGDGVVEDAETERRFLNAMKKEISALSRLIDDLFQMAQIDAGGLKLNIEPVSLSDLISDTLESFSQIAERQGVALSGDVERGLGVVPLDAPRINRVLNNLIDNAIRHTPDGGSVRLQVYQRAPDIFIEIEDTGSGIPEADLPNIFDRFYQSEKSRNRRSGGSGLGLAISRGIIEAHRGEISVTSHPGRTRFVVKLPLDVSSAPGR
jgi:signal transduction histidine kinase